MTSTEQSISPRLIAETLETLVDVLVPGDDLFPPASTVGTHGLVAERLRASLGLEAIFRLIDRLTLGGVSFVSLSPDRRRQVVKTMEAEDDGLFDWLVNVTYLSYYQSPMVVETIRRLGHDYNHAPQPRGYPMEPFDPNLDLPAQPRGAYVPTEEVRPVDLSALDHLQDLLGVRDARQES